MQMKRREILKINSDGWLVESENISILHSLNFDDRPKNESISLVVIHCISLPSGNFVGDNVEKLFLNEIDTSKDEFTDLENLRVSAHFYIKRNGQIVQFVSIHKRAWHAGTSSFKGASNCNNFSVGIEIEGTEDIVYEKRQYDSLITLLYSLSKKLPSINAITGHENIAPKRNK